MRWADLPLRPSAKVLRQFAGAWLAFGLALGLYEWLARGHHRLGPILCLLAVGVGVSGLIRPGLVRWLFIAATVAAFPLGWLVSQAVLLFLFFAVITPFSLWFRLRGRDPLGRRRQPDRPSFWVPKQQPRDISRYFRQY